MTYRIATAQLEIFFVNDQILDKEGRRIMNIEEILAGESKNVEFKENLPEKSIKYMKSVVAFANGTGGKIIFGIADKTREVIGFDKEDVFKKMDAIANAVSDSCEPAIIPDITLRTVDGKTVIVAEISEGRQQLRSWGVLIERDGKDYPSNAFAILTGNGGLHVTTQCGVFKGTTKAVFVDRREYPGPLWEQIDEAFQFVLRNIHFGATALAHAFAYDNNIKNGVNVDTNSIDGVGIGANGIKNDVDEVAYIDKVFPDHIQKLLKIIAENPTETQAQYAEKLGISKRTISRIFAELKDQGILEQQGNRRKAKWLIIKKR